MPLPETYNPLTDPSPTEIPLAEAPLVKVVSQVRFPLIASLDSREFIAPFQEAIRKKYPVLRPEDTHSATLGRTGVQSSTVRIWRFSNATGDWKVSLAPDFVALETTSYESRSDFLARLEEVLSAVEEHIDPGIADRSGIRYIDRVEGESPESFRSLVRPEVAGVISAPFVNSTSQLLNQNMFTFPGGKGQLSARWSVMPPDTTPDPSAIDPIGSLSWILDLDAFSGESRPWDSSALIEEIEGFAERVYAFFRWSVTDDFLARFKGATGE